MSVTHSAPQPLPNPIAATDRRRARHGPPRRANGGAGAPPRGPTLLRKALLNPRAALQNGEKVKNPQVRESSGAALVARVRADMDAEGLVPDGREEELLVLAGDLQDRIVELEDAIAADGLRQVSKSGVVHLHPAVSEVRQTRAVLARALAGVQMQDDTRDPVKQKAAQARWRSHNAAKRSS